MEIYYLEDYFIKVNILRNLLRRRKRINDSSELILFFLRILREPMEMREYIVIELLIKE